MSLFELIQEVSPLVISVPHDGALIPDDIRETMNSEVLNSSDRDYLINDVFTFDDWVYSKIKANYSRHVIDLNRPASGKALYKNQAETELCPTTTFDHQAIYPKEFEPSEQEIKKRIHLYWQPYHDQLRLLIDAAVNQFGFCLLIDAHSIDDQVPRFFSGALPDINVGTFSGLSCDAHIERLLTDQLSAQNKFSYVINGRFKGGYITRHYGQPTHRIHAIQLEHAKSAYLDDTLKMSEKGVILRHLWRQSIDKMLNNAVL